MNVTPAYIPKNLVELVRYADVIVDGTVTELMPGRLRNPRDTTSVETDALITVRKALKGPASMKAVVVTQLGGTYGDLEIVPDNYEMLKVGDRHILFLTSDRRRSVPIYPQADGAFQIASVMMGNFKVEQNSLRLSPLVPAGLKAHEKTGINEFVGQVEMAVRTAGLQK